ncbi:trehalose-phosphatase [Acetobacter sp. AN02]|uniref:trehalose-phosphatase n=1 Tax=Acetobacter sp. AN02 TaxID=2894186 RepID=UPI00243444E4|nr:trehalose-phosphatase [Acetobacter sp. AN02]MDG6094838.1 trehalose-phosphatase [Acetobacter sp. AN02]
MSQSAQAGHGTGMSRIPPLEKMALLLDFDGTLVDIAPSPDAVIVPEGLKETLLRLRDACGEALAIITGRPIAQIDHFLPDVPFAIAGEHGAVVRRRPGGPAEHAALPAVPPEWIAAARDLAQAWPGVHVEHKTDGFVLHFRAAPEAGQALHDAAASWIASHETGEHFRLLESKMAWEIRPAGIDKGQAVRLLMETWPFTGRIPVFIGDDRTDEDAIREVEAMGGAGLRIPADFPTPSAFRNWLKELN